MPDTPSRTSALSTIKWVAIAVTMIVIALIGYKVYQIITSPVRAVQSVGDNVAEATDTLKDKASNVVNRLDVPIDKNTRFNIQAEAAFATLISLPQTPPLDFNERLIRTTSLRHSDHRVCRLDLDFGNGPLPIYAAANHTRHATSKALGSKEDRLIRVHMVTSGEHNIALRAYWDHDTQDWKMRWRRATLKKPISDSLAHDRLLDVLKAVPDQCARTPLTGSPL